MNLGLAVGLVLSPIAACIAYVITYGEYRKHFPDIRTPIVYELQAAFVAFVVFLALSLLLGWLLGQGLFSIQGKST